MSNQTPFSLRIFVADGDPDGLRLVERSNWIGKAVMFPRSIYPRVRSRTEFQQTGVYLLVGPQQQGDGESIYIGEGDPVRPRLERHYAEKDFWQRAVFFVAGPGQLNKAHVQYLEARLVKLAAEAKRMPLENGNRPTEPTLSDADLADMQVFLDNMLGMLPVLGIHAFEQSAPMELEGQTPMLTLRGRGAMATGYDTPQGFVVRAGSIAALEEQPALKDNFPNVSKLRDSLRESGVLVPNGAGLKFTQDYTFNSPSLAGAVLKGCTTNGRLEWKDASGRTLRQLQEAQATT